MIYKIFWALRAVIYAPFFGKFGFPSYLGKPLFLMGTRKVFIGKKVRIFPHLRLEVHRNGNIHIGDDVVISQNVHITSAGNLTIGKSSLILANVFITNIDHDYQELNTHVVKQEYLVNETVIGENCYINNALIDKNVRIGNNVHISGGKHLDNFTNELYSIKDGIVVIKKGVVLSDNFRIE